MNKEPEYRIKISSWSATDFTYLLNETNGWVDDDGEYYEFGNLEDYNKMKIYLKDLADENS